MFSAPIIVRMIRPRGRSIFIWADEDGYIFVDKDLKLSDEERHAVFESIQSRTDIEANKMILESDNA